MLVGKNTVVLVQIKAVAPNAQERNELLLKEVLPETVNIINFIKTSIFKYMLFKYSK